MKNAIFAIILFTIFAANSNAQTGETEVYAEFKKIDKELNVVYKKLKNKLNKLDKEALIKSQRDWLKFRSSNCIFKSKEASEGGVIANKMKIDCEVEMTKARIKEFNYILDDF